MDRFVDNELLKRLAEELTGEWKDVARNLNLTEATIFNITVDNLDSIKETKYQMLLKWRQTFGDKATIDTLAKALNKSKRTDLLTIVFDSKVVDRRSCFDRRDNRIPDLTHGKALSDTMTEFKEALKKKYRNMYSLMRPIPWKKHIKWSIKDLFIDAGLLHLEDMTKDSKDEKNWRPKQTIEALFTDDALASANRIVIEGGPGCGKSTLMLQLAYLWCEGMSPMENVEVFILLPLKQVKVDTSICKAIKQILLPRDFSMTESDIDNILHAKPFVVLALDGLDECPALGDETFQNSDFMAIFREEMFIEVKGIVSTRLSCLHDLADGNAERVRMQKFERKHWLEYIKKITLNEEQAGLSDAIFRVINEHQILQSLCEIPLFLSLLTQIIREDVTLGKSLKFQSVTEVFKHIVTCMKAHHSNKKVTISSKIASDKPSTSFDEMALSGLMSSSKCNTWDKTTLESILNYQLLVDSGIFVEEDGEVSLGTSISEVNLSPIAVSFIHQLFQEWFGARFLAHLCRIRRDRFQKVLETINPSELHYLLQFTCGLNPDATKPILQYLLSISHVDTFSLCFGEHIGDKDSIHDQIVLRCHYGFKLQEELMWQIAYLTADVNLLTYATNNEIPVTEVEISSCRAVGDALKIGGVMLKPVLSAVSISLTNWPGDDTYRWLNQCRSLKQLKIHLVVKVRADRLWKLLEERQTKVLMAQSPTSMAHRFGLRKGKWERTHDVECNGCRTKEIVGIRYKCMDCEMHNLCSSCIGKTDSVEHHQFRQISGIERCYNTACGCYRNTLCDSCTDLSFDYDFEFREYYGVERYRCVVCCNCGDELMETLYYRCKTCRYFIMCDPCKRNGVHDHHEHLRRDRDEVALHIGTECRTCKESPIEGDRYRCLTCIDFNLCECCNEKEHKQHEMLMLKGKLRQYNFQCEYCGDKPITGLRYRCTACPNINLCEVCKGRGKHEGKHEFQIVEKEKITYSDLVNVGCEKDPLTGRRYKCSDCKEFELCERCLNADTGVKHNEEHVLEDSEEEDELIHSNVVCDGCEEDPLRGQRYQCSDCKDFDLCEKCFNTDVRVKHNEEHVLEEADENEVDHANMFCAGCEMYPLKGLRFKCMTCWKDDYNLCERCINEDIHPQHDFKIFEFENSLKIQYCHRRISCDVCKKSYIGGNRYRCTTCWYFNVCEACKGMHTEHEYHQFNGTEVKHVFVQCNSCKELPIIGVRYKCKQCPWLNFCGCCKKRGYHAEHEYEKITKVKHIFVKCNLCQELPIIGVRYKCKACPWFNLCEGCTGYKHNKEHEDHQFEEIPKSLLVCKKCDREDPLTTDAIYYKCKTCPSFNLCEHCKDGDVDHVAHEFAKITLVKHHSVQCKSCLELPIIGVRYKCKTCPNFDLCHSCYENEDHEDHEFEGIPKSAKYPRSDANEVTTSFE